MTGSLVLAATILATSAPAARAGEPRPLYDVDVFTRVGAPGFPEGIAVAPDGTVYTSTDPVSIGPGTPLGPDSTVIAYRPDGTVGREYVLQGQDKTAAALPSYGLHGAALDGDGILYVGDKAPARVIRLDPTTGAQSDYARFPDVKPCAGAPDGTCSATTTDLLPSPDGLTFGPDGTMYVADTQQGVIWRVPPGGGSASIALTSPLLDTPMGANQPAFLRGGTELAIPVSVNPPGVGTPGSGTLYTSRVGVDGSLGELQALYTSDPGAGLDGLSVGASGTIYLNQFLESGFVVLDPDGTEKARVLANPTTQEIPFDAPANSAFVGDRLLVTNHAFVDRNAANFAILDANVGEPGLPLFRPRLPRPAPVGPTAVPAATAATTAATAGRVSCLPHRVAVGANRIGPLVLGRRQTRLGAATPLTRTSRVLRFCVERNDRRVRAAALLDRRGRVRLATTVARGHRDHGVGVGDTVAELRRRLPGLRSGVGRSLVARTRSGLVVFTVRRGRVSRSR